MNSSNSKKKRAKRIIHIRYRKASSASKSYSHIVNTAGYKKRIASLSKNNIFLAKALQESRQELSDVKSYLETSKENLHEMMYFRNKMQLMHSTLRTFVDDFHKALQLVKWDDTKWPTSKQVMRPLKTLKSKMQSDINPIEETSMTDSVVSESSSLLVESRTSSGVYDSNSVASNSNKFPEKLWTDQEKKTGESDDQISTNKPVIGFDQQNSEKIDAKYTQSSDSALPDDILKTPFSLNVPLEESNGAAHLNGNVISNGTSLAREDDISRTPELSILSVPTINLCPVKSKNSRIPKRHNLSASIKKKTHLLDNPYQGKSSSSVKTGINVSESNSDFHQAMPVTENLVTSTKNVHNLASHVTVATSTNLKCPGIVDVNRRKTFSVEDFNKISDNEVISDRTQEDRRKTFVKKTQSADSEINVSRNKRETFIISKKMGAEEDTSNIKCCNMILDTSISNNVTENTTVSLTNDTDISPDLGDVPVLNTIISVRNTETKNNAQSVEVIVKDVVNKPVLDNTEDPLLNFCDKSKGFDNTLHLAKSSDIPMISAQQLQNSDQNRAEMYDSGSKDTLTNHIEGKNSDSSAKVNPISSQNICVEFETSSENEERHILKIKNAQSSDEVNAICSVNANIGVETETNIESEVNEKCVLKVKSSKSLAEANAASSKNICLLFETSNEEKENEKTVLKAAKVQVKENLNSSRNLKNKEIVLDDDIIMLKDSESESMSSAHRRQRKVSYIDFFSSSDTEEEEIPDINFDFLEDVPVKDPPIRRCISKSRPPKVFIFDANKRKSSFLRDRLKKVRPVKNSKKVFDSDVPSSSLDQNIQNPELNIEEVQVCKESVRFCADECVKINNALNKESNKSKQKSRKTPKFPCYAPNKDILSVSEDIISSENMTTDKFKTKLCFTSDTVVPATDKTNVLSVNAKKYASDQNEHTVSFKHEENVVYDTAIEIYHSDIENKSENKVKNLKRMKQKSHNDQILIDDCVSEKKSKKHKVVNPENIFSASENKNSGYKLSKKKLKSKDKNEEKKNKSNWSTSCKNSIVVHAEIHPPPSSLNLSPCNLSHKEIDQVKNRELSVLLSDVFQTDVIKELKLSCDKEMFLSKGKDPLPAKTPLSDNSVNVQSTVSKDSTKAASAPGGLEEINRVRHRRGTQICYKEPPLNVKIRR